MKNILFMHTTYGLTLCFGGGVKYTDSDDLVVDPSWQIASTTMEYVTPGLKPVIAITVDVLLMVGSFAPELVATLTSYSLGLHSAGSGGTTVKLPDVLEVGAKLITAG